MASASELIVESRKAHAENKKDIIEKTSNAPSPSAEKARKANLKRKYMREVEKLNSSIDDLAGKERLKARARLGALKEGIKRLDGNGTFGLR